MGRAHIAWVVVLAACTNGAPPTGRITVITRTRGGFPLAGQSIVFQAADGHIYAHQRTDANGRAEGPMGPDGMVTWYTGILAGKHQLFTETAVSPGEDVVLVADRGPPVDHRLQVQLPAAPHEATNVRLWTGCAEAQVDAPIRKATLNMTAECPESGTVVLGYAYDQARVPVAYALARHPRVDAADLMVREWTPFELHTAVSLGHPPHDATASSAWITPSLEGRGFGPQTRRLPSGPQPTVEFGRPEAFGDDLLVGIGVDYDRESSLVQQVVSATTTQLTVNAAASFLPRVHAVHVDLDGPTVSWSPEPGLEAAADLVDIEVAWPRGHWYFVTPAGTSLVLPDLPSALDAAPEPPLAAVVAYTDYFGFDDYRAVRAANSTTTRSWRASFAVSPADSF